MPRRPAARRRRLRPARPGGHQPARQRRPPRAGRERRSGCRRHRDDPFVRLEVSDQGTGIRPDRSGRASSNPSTAAGSRSSGVGLAICRGDRRGARRDHPVPADPAAGQHSRSPCPVHRERVAVTTDPRGRRRAGHPPPLTAALPPAATWSSQARPAATRSTPSPSRTRTPSILDLGLRDIDGIEVCRADPAVVRGADHRADRPRAPTTARSPRSTRAPTTTSRSRSRCPNCSPGCGSLLRRRGPRRATTTTRCCASVELVIDLPRHEVTVAGAAGGTDAEGVRLPRPARPLPRSRAHPPHDAAGGVGPGYGTETQYLRVYASQIRKKLGPEGGQMLVSEPGIGYRLLDPSEE